MQENLTLLHANNTGTDQPAQPVGTFVISYLESVIAKLAMCKASVLLLVSVAGQADLSLTWTETQKTSFLA